MSISCTIWSYVIIIRLLINDYDCYEIIKNYDELSVFMQITNFIILNLILIVSIIGICIYNIKSRNKKQNKVDSDMVELVIK